MIHSFNCQTAFPNVKLHEAIAEVIKRHDRPMRAAEIAYALNHEMILYRKRDGSEIKSNQISARINHKKYSHLFVKDGPFIELSHGSSAVLYPRNKTGVKTIHERSQKPVKAVNPSLVVKLLDIENFCSAGNIDQIVPGQPGIYAIRIKNIDNLPDTFSEALNKRGHNLIYIGIASKSLKERMLGNELRARGHGTLFRSLGAVLDYRPLKGSLKGKRNKKNYTFSGEDKEGIITWINRNLLVNWMCMDNGLRELEKCLIVSQEPLLNIRDNRCKLPELEELRKKCRVIAAG